MDRLICFGAGSRIATELGRLLPAGCRLESSRLASDLGDLMLQAPDHRAMADRFVFCAGVLHPLKIGGQARGQIEESLAVNFVNVIRWCEFLLANNPRARICVLGSISGIKGSFDRTYAASKAALHNYVETRRLSSPEQQLVAVAPSIIEDSGMTERRKDLPDVIARARKTPKERLLTSAEVARLIHFLLFVDRGYITNTVVRIDGGQLAGSAT